MSDAWKRTWKDPAKICRCGSLVMVPWHRHKPWISAIILSDIQFYKIYDMKTVRLRINETHPIDYKRPSKR